MSAEQRRNTWLLGLDMAIFAMGLVALGQLTIIPLFVSKLTDSPLAVVAVLTLGDGARSTERRARAA